MRVGSTVYAGLVAFTWAKIHEDLVVAKVVRRVEGEELILILMGKTDRHSTPVDQVELREVFKPFHNCLISNEHAAVQGWNEESEKFITGPALSFEVENVVELLNHGAKQFID